jgi:hypothetical protein
VGHFDEPQCVVVCPVECIPKDPAHPDTQQQLLGKFFKLHPDKTPYLPAATTAGDSAASSQTGTNRGLLTVHSRSNLAFSFSMQGSDNLIPFFYNSLFIELDFVRNMSYINRACGL